MNKMPDKCILLDEIPVDSGVSETTWHWLHDEIPVDSGVSEIIWHWHMALFCRRTQSQHISNICQMKFNTWYFIFVFKLFPYTAT